MYNFPRNISSYLNVVRVDDLPLKVQGLHGPVDLAHDVVRFALTPDTEVPLAPLDGGTTVGLLHYNYQMLRLWVLKSVTQGLVKERVQSKQNN